MSTLLTAMVVAFSPHTVNHPDRPSQKEVHLSAPSAPLSAAERCGPNNHICGIVLLIHEKEVGVHVSFCSPMVWPEEISRSGCAYVSIPGRSNAKSAG